MSAACSAGAPSRRVGQPAPGDGHFGLPCGEVHGHPDQEAVQLRLGQQIGAGEVHRVLGGDTKKGAGSRWRAVGHGHLALLHGLQQRGLRPGRGPVDLVRDDHMGEQRPRPEGAHAAGEQRLLVPGDLGGQQVGRELDPPPRLAPGAGATQAAIARASVVLPVPGRPSTSRWPPASRHNAAISTAARCPVKARSTGWIRPVRIRSAQSVPRPQQWRTSAPPGPAPGRIALPRPALARPRPAGRPRRDREHTVGDRPSTRKPHRWPTFGTNAYNDGRRPVPLTRPGAEPVRGPKAAGARPPRPPRTPTPAYGARKPHRWRRPVPLPRPGPPRGRTVRGPEDGPRKVAASGPEQGPPAHSDPHPRHTAPAP